jgi:hypothetical protein
MVFTYTQSQRLINASIAKKATKPSTIIVNNNIGFLLRLRENDFVTGSPQRLG